MRLMIASTLAVALGTGVLEQRARAAQSSQDAARPQGTITAPERTKFVAPIYPKIAQAARVQGDVVLDVAITSSGKVERATVVRSIPLLNQAAIDAVMQWEYKPARLNDVPVAIVMTATVTFRLSESPATDTAPIQWFGIPQSLMPTGPAVPYVRLANTHVMAGRFVDAADALTLATQAEPGNAACWFMLGGIQSHNRNPQRNIVLAAEAMRRAIALGVPPDSFMSRTAQMVLAEPGAAGTGSDPSAPASTGQPGGAPPSVRPGAPDPPAPSGPSQRLFSGRWQCTVYGSEALMNQFSFTVNDDGTVSLAGLAEEPRAAITPSSIQFESRGGGTVDSTSLRGNGSRLDGTRTLTTPAMGVVPATNTSHRISCVPSEQRRPPTTTRADAGPTSESEGRLSADQQVLIQDMVSSIQKLGGDSAALRVFKSDVASGQISMPQLAMMINTLIQNERDPDIRRTLETIRSTLGSTASQPNSPDQPSTSASPAGRTDSAAGGAGVTPGAGDRDYSKWTCVPGSGIRCLPGRTSFSNDKVEVAEAGAPGQLALRHDSGRPLVLINVYRRASWIDNGIQKVQIDLGIANNTKCGFQAYAVFFEDGNISDEAVWPSKRTTVAANKYEVQTVILSAKKNSVISVEASGKVVMNLNGLQCY